MIKRIDGIFGFKVLYGEFDTMSFNSGRECGDALDPIYSNLYDRLERSVVLVEDKSSLVSEQCLAEVGVCCQDLRKSSLLRKCVSLVSMLMT